MALLDESHDYESFGTTYVQQPQGWEFHDYESFGTTYVQQPQGWKFQTLFLSIYPWKYNYLSILCT